MSDTVLVIEHDGWVELTLNRPEKLNSFNEEMHLSLKAALESAVNNGARALLLTGAGRGFCAGQDLADRDPAKLDGPPDLSRTLTEFYNPLVRYLRNSAIPIVCAVNGVAAGAGANLALVCDLVLASDNAKFVQSFSKVGLIPDSGGTWTLTQLLGVARAKALALTAAPIDAQQAENWGLIYRCVPADQLMAEARELTHQLAKGPTQGFKHIKQAIHAATVNEFDEQLDLEAKLQKICGESPDYREGVAAFLAKREPSFSGKSS